MPACPLRPEIAADNEGNLPPRRSRHRVRLGCIATLADAVLLWIVIIAVVRLLVPAIDWLVQLF